MTFWTARKCDTGIADFFTTMFTLTPGYWSINGLIKRVFKIIIMNNLTISLARCLLVAISTAAAGTIIAEDSPVAETQAAELTTVDIYTRLVFGSPERIIEGLDETAASREISAASEAVPEPVNAAYDNLMDRIRQSRTSIDALEFSGGPWDIGLAEELASLGGMFQQQGAFQQAIEMFDRAMHVTRINHGLDNLEQVPVVEQLINSYLAMGEWDKADQFHTYLYYTQKKAYGLNDPRMIPVLDRLARWNLSVFNVGYGDAVGLRLTNAFYLYRTASNIVDLHFGKQDERFVNYLEDMAGAAYLVSRNPGLMAEATRPEYRNTQAMFNDAANQINPITSQGYREGLEALEEVARLYAGKEEARLDYAQALIRLADWYLMFERRRTAADHYTEAYNLIALMENGDQLVQETFFHVEALPELSVNIEELTLGARVDMSRMGARRSGVLEVEFDVTSYGAATDIDVLTEETDENTRVISALRRKVRSTVFRPTVVDGELVRSENNRFQYRYWY